MTYSYKHLKSSDLNTFKKLLKVFGEAFDEKETYQDKVPSDTYLKSFLDKEHVIALAALENDEVAGGLVAYVLEKFEQDRREIYIYDLAVDENHRRQKVATQLILELKKIAKKLKAYVIYVQADPVDPPAMKLYESLGTKESVFHYDIAVD